MVIEPDTSWGSDFPVYDCHTDGSYRKYWNMMIGLRSSQSTNKNAIPRSYLTIHQMDKVKKMLIELSAVIKNSSVSVFI